MVRQRLPFGEARRLLTERTTIGFAVGIESGARHPTISRLQLLGSLVKLLGYYHRAK